MKLIIESGSTKTNWRIINGKSITRLDDSIGLNPINLSKNEIVSVLEKVVTPEKLQNDIKSIYFYGAGCQEKASQKIVLDAFNSFFDTKNISIESDIIASAKALFGDENGISCILGTGSNVCLFENGIKVANRSGFGYILGDEGSGAYLGKSLIQDYLNGFVPLKIKLEFESFFKLNREKIITKVYRESNANLFFANFSTYILKNISEAYFYNLSKKCFQLFFKLHIETLPNYKKSKLGFVGSVAFYYQDIIKEVAEECSVEVYKIIEKPIDELVKYHLNQG